MRHVRRKKTWTRLAIWPDAKRCGRTFDELYKSQRGVGLNAPTRHQDCCHNDDTSAPATRAQTKTEPHSKRGNVLDCAGKAQVSKLQYKRKAATVIFRIYSSSLSIACSCFDVLSVECWSKACPELKVRCCAAALNIAWPPRAAAYTFRAR